MSEYNEFFKFAAKVGALEGYLFKRDRVEPLANWIGNIEGMYQSLSPAVRKEINFELEGVLQRTLEYGDRVLAPEMKDRLNRLLAEVRGVK
ncbi:MAG: hypothetical protein HY673_27040 [Chloroflexi bacterium]|nr:hypothetical protein [Chloroflexota bacterium]